jgi:outer membrane receptor for monomeric catechols
VTLTGGFRRSKNEFVTSNLDRGRTQIGAAGRIDSEADSWTYGIVVEALPGVNLYASSNEGESVQAGSLIDTFSSLSQPNLITPAERAANPSPNLIGKGLEAGVKFELFDRKVTGSIAWFDLRTRNTLVNDTVKTGADPRNIGTEADPNPATANPSRPGNVSWSLPIDGNISRGFEWDFVISPTRSYDIVIAGTHMTANLQTVSPPNSSDPLARRNYEILNGRPLSNNPDNILRVWQHYRFAGRLKGASVGLGVRYMSSLMPIARDQNWGTIMPSATVADLALSYTTKIVGREMQFQIHVNNVTDEFFTETGRMVAPPREFSFTTRLRF